MVTGLILRGAAAAAAIGVGCAAGSGCAPCVGPFRRKLVQAPRQIRKWRWLRATGAAPTRAQGEGHTCIEGVESPAGPTGVPTTSLPARPGGLPARLRPGPAPSASGAGAPPVGQEHRHQAPGEDHEPAEGQVPRQPDCGVGPVSQRRIARDQVQPPGASSHHRIPREHRRPREQRRCPRQPRPVPAGYVFFHDTNLKNVVPACRRP